MQDIYFEQIREDWEKFKQKVYACYYDRVPIKILSVMTDLSEYQIEQQLINNFEEDFDFWYEGKLIIIKRQVADLIIERVKDDERRISSFKRNNRRS